MKEILLFDTDILIDHLRGLPQALNYLESSIAQSLCYISTITIAELYTGVKDDNEKKILDLYIGEFHISALTSQIAKQAGFYRQEYRKSHGIGIADAIIASTAESVGAKLITLNVKHYPMFKKLSPPYLKP